MRWWCSAQNTSWTWAWQPYLGVWLFIAAVALAYLWHVRSVRSAKVEPRRAAYFITGLILLWAALDWPIGPLGASYLASVHMMQYLLIGIAAPALILLGVPRQSFLRIRNRPKMLHTLESVANPLAAFFVFNVIMTVTHWPDIVDVMMRTQVGSFTLDMAWLIGGLIFWWPIVAPVPEWPRFSAMFKVAYLALNVVLVRPPFALLLFSKFPVYETYELAPPVGTLHIMDDQQLAGGIMKIGSGWIMAIGVAVILYRWHRQREALQRSNAGVTDAA